MAHVTSQPVHARGGLSITSEFRTMEGGGSGRQERVMGGGIGSPGLAGQGTWGPYDCLTLTALVCLPYPGAK